MKTRWLLMTAACLLFAGSALAQHLKLTTNVPFDFVVNNLTFPHGEYMVSAFEDGRRLLIQNKNQPEYSTYIFNLNVYRHAQVGKIIFIRTNGQHVLHQIAFEGDDHIHDIVHEGKDPIELVALR